MDNSKRILNFLGKNHPRKFSMHNLSVLLGIPYATFYRTIKKLGDLIITQSIGQTKAITLNTHHPQCHAHLTIASEEEKNEFLTQHPIMRALSSDLNTGDIVVLFGSYAKGTQRQRSDIDLLIINKQGERTISFSKHELLFRKEINPIFISEEEFTLMLNNDEENVGKQARKSHIILNNARRFWDLVLYGI